mgnify:CR=1 FL=1
MKTLEELEKLTDDELRVMLAEIVNPGFEIAYWTYCNVTRDKDGDPQLEPIADVPNYPGDLNACHEVENSLGDEYPTHNREFFRKQLRKVADKAQTSVDSVVVEALTRHVASRR